MLYMIKWTCLSYLRHWKSWRYLTCVRIKGNLHHQLACLPDLLCHLRPPSQLNLNRNFAGTKLIKTAKLKFDWCECFRKHLLRVLNDKKRTSAEMRFRAWMSSIQTMKCIQRSVGNQTNPLRKKMMMQNQWSGRHFYNTITKCFHKR